MKEWNFTTKVPIHNLIIKHMTLVTIYYNDVFVSDHPFEIYANCPYVNVPIEEAIEYADNKIENGEWDAYCIPELVTSHEVVFHDHKG